MSQEQDAKGAFIEKLLFALLPLIIAGVGALIGAFVISQYRPNAA